VELNRKAGQNTPRVVAPSEEEEEEYWFSVEFCVLCFNVCVFMEQIYFSLLFFWPDFLE
jgi:hypothetical protein